MESALTTEEKIRQAATRLFLEKGFDGTTTRDIAAEAGINVALLNYYFRSKQKLFDSVFEEMLLLFFAGVNTVLRQPIPLREKIVALIDHDFTTFRQSPDLVIFVLSELHRNPDLIVSSIIDAEAKLTTLFQEQLEEAHRAGLIRSINASHLMSIMSANTQSVFINKNVHLKLWNQTEEQFEAFALEHKKLIADMIINYLFIT
ncbi:TetR/AcrR family transcriptional regulator [Spirosoma rhododendri]|uniref:TetR/AcrR family transcriptional regulator n=1 Tax=Spirosoma rhododendri TaxID=2728024 RepID=A0A7L5DR84_9BACT|nr:TetR/AcrR family transcriptional regulator [Spirosoma rhododendri]QJD79733.1 TetR/AcrR family transcriptional regulator [Spirosoma rhododendri]